MGGEFKWDAKESSVILGSIFYGYISMLFAGGLLAQRFGGKRVMLIGLATSSVLTLLTPVAARNGDFPGILVVRILMGMGQVEKL